MYVCVSECVVVRGVTFVHPEITSPRGSLSGEGGLQGSLLWEGGGGGWHPNPKIYSGKWQYGPNPRVRFPPWGRLVRKMAGQRGGGECGPSKYFQPVGAGG